VLFRDDVRSNRISFRETDPDRFLADLAAIEREERAYVVTAMDAETYGHHISGWEREFLAAVYERIGDGGTPVRMLQPSEVVAEFPPGPIIEPHAASWSTTPDDLAGGNPFPLWRAPGNAIHAGQWEIVDHCFALVEMALAHAPAGSEAERFARRADASLQPALHSCQFWWASRRPMWDPLMVQRGLALLEEALIFAGRAIELGDAGAREKSLARWRTAAAREAKARIEDALIVEVGG
jgi:alpha-amylase/alpha-mannosidase (GH57 family)